MSTQNSYPVAPALACHVNVAGNCGQSVLAPKRRLAILFAPILGHLPGPVQAVPPFPILPGVLANYTVTSAIAKG